MLEIKKQRELTVHDFIKNKDYYPFKNWRFTAKQINFSLLFGCSAMRFAVMLENSGYTESEAMEYIQQTNSLPMFNTEVIKQQGKMSKKKVAYLVAATLMREAYFNSYQGLATRIAREQEYGRRHGYVRTWHGPVRHLPELKYCEYGPNGKPAGADKELYSQEFAHLYNDACNSTVQSLESRIAFSTWHEANKYLKEWNLKSRIWNNIHDSFDLWIWKPELELVASLMNACASWERPPVYGIHMSLDLEVADVQDMEHRENTYWKHGQPVNIIPIEEAVEHWNELHKNTLNFKPIEWHGCDC